MAEYRITISPQYGDHIYEEDMRTLHVVVSDVFASKVELGSWCKDDIRVTNADTGVSVLFKPWMEVAPGSHRAMYQGIHEDRLLYLDIWKDRETRNRIVTKRKQTI